MLAYAPTPEAEEHTHAPSASAQAKQDAVTVVDNGTPEVEHKPFDKKQLLVHMRKNRKVRPMPNEPKHYCSIG